MSYDFDPRTAAMDMVRKKGYPRDRALQSARADK